MDEYYMKLAIKEARKAYKIGDTPIGCVIVYNENKKNTKMYDRVKNLLVEKKSIILSKAYNKRNKLKNTIKHAEIIAIDRACKKTGDFRLEDCTMYVTLEPCPMCAGAILQSRIKKIVIATKSMKSGSFGSVINILNENKFNHKIEIQYGVCEEESRDLLQKFFKEIRDERKDF